MDSNPDNSPQEDEMRKVKPPREEIPRGEEEDAGDSQPKPSGRLRHGGHIEHYNPQW